MNFSEFFLYFVVVVAYHVTNVEMDMDCCVILIVVSLLIYKTMQDPLKIIKIKIEI